MCYNTTNSRWQPHRTVPPCYLHMCYTSHTQPDLRQLYHPACPSGLTRFILTRTKNLNNEYGATGRHTSSHQPWARARAVVQQLEQAKSGAITYYCTRIFLHTILSAFFFKH